MATITKTEHNDQLHFVIIKEEQQEIGRDIKELETYHEEANSILYARQEMTVNDVNSIKIEEKLLSIADGKCCRGQNTLNLIKEEDCYHESIECYQFTTNINKNNVDSCIQTVKESHKAERMYKSKENENISIKYEINDGLHSALIVKKEMDEEESSGQDGIISTDNEDKNELGSDSVYAYIEDKMTRDNGEPCSSFVSRVNLIRHDKINTTKKTLKCDKCEKFFIHMSDLKRHIMIHTGEKPFKCDKCKKSFNHIGTLNRHGLTHTGDKPFKCDTCEKTFTMRNSLKRHSILHTGKKPFKCNLCEKMFTRSEDLKKHGMSHTNERPFKCDKCAKSFNHKEYLKKHNRIHDRS